jgi:hypothetical protein
MMGTERKSMVMDEEERRNTAYHEAGHALVGKPPHQLIDLRFGAHVDSPRGFIQK